MPDPVDRAAALRRLHVALDEFHVVGLHTNLPFLRTLSAHPAFQSGKVSTGFIPRYHKELLPPQAKVSDDFIALATLSLINQEARLVRTGRVASSDEYSPWAHPSAFRLSHQSTRTIKWMDDKRTINVKVTYHANPDDGTDPSYDLLIDGNDTPIEVCGHLAEGDSALLTAIVNGKRYSGAQVVWTTSSSDSDAVVNIFHQGHMGTLQRPLQVVKASAAAAQGSLLSPMPGKIVKVNVKAGDKVEKGTPLIIMEAMKMEHTIRAPTAGVVENVFYVVGDLVEEKKVLASLKAS